MGWRGPIEPVIVYTEVCDLIHLIREAISVVTIPRNVRVCVRGERLPKLGLGLS